MLVAVDGAAGVADVVDVPAQPVHRAIPRRWPVVAVPAQLAHQVIPRRQPVVAGSRSRVVAAVEAAAGVEAVVLHHRRKSQRWPRWLQWVRVCCRFIARPAWVMATGTRATRTVTRQMAGCRQ